MRLSDKVFEEPCSFVISDLKNTHTDMYIQMRSVDEKDDWTRQIQSLLDKQMDFLESKF